MLKQNKSVSIHQRNLQILATEIFKTKNSLDPVIMEDVFKFKNITYNFRNAETLNSQQLSTLLLISLLLLLICFILFF